MRQAVADGEPWRYCDLGHGLCTYEFIDQCAHRVACARPDFYRLKDKLKFGLIRDDEPSEIT